MDPQATDAGHLDAQELLHLALSAMNEQREAEAISLLKRGIALTPDDGRMHYLLGAMHAQVGLRDRAVEEMQRAVALAPEIDMAHFQLGLLLLTSGQVEPARQAWQALDRLDAEHPLNLFRHGMLALVVDAFDDCIDRLQRGIERNSEYEALNRDMQRVIDAAQAARGPGAPSAGAVDAGAQHVLLAGYRPPGKGS